MSRRAQPPPTAHVPSNHTRHPKDFTMLADPFFWQLMLTSFAVMCFVSAAHRYRLQRQGGVGTVKQEGGHIDE